MVQITLIPRSEFQRIHQAAVDRFAKLALLADMATQLDAAELLTLRAAWMEDNHLHYEKAAAMAKMMASDAAMQAAIEGVQILGGYGYCREYPMERHMRDAKITQIYEGTNQIQRNVIAAHMIKETLKK